MQQLLNGFFYVIDGFKLISKPGLKRFVIIPLVINTLLFSGMFLLARHYFADFHHFILGFIPSWLQWLGFIFWIIFIFGFFLIFIYTFVIVANLIAAPFNSLLSEHVAFYLSGEVIVSQGFAHMIKTIPRSIARQIAILVYYVPRALLLFILLFIPLIHPVMFVIWILFNAWFMALQYFDYPADNRGISFPALRGFLAEHRLLAFGFGSGVLLVSLVPLLNLLAMPASVAGGTKLWLDKAHRKEAKRA